VDRYTGLEKLPGVIAVRMGGRLFFADAHRFRGALNELIRSSGEPVRALVVDATAISQTDTDGADIVIQIAQTSALEGSRSPSPTWSGPSSSCGRGRARSTRSAQTASSKQCEPQSRPSNPPPATTVATTAPP
jgi:MFS superfamily sulfate permease-like transporter